MRQWHFAIFFQVSGWQLFWHVGHQKRCFPGYSPLTPINLCISCLPGFNHHLDIFWYYLIFWQISSYPFLFPMIYGCRSLGSNFPKSFRLHHGRAVHLALPHGGSRIFRWSTGSHPQPRSDWDPPGKPFGSEKVVKQFGKKTNSLFTWKLQRSSLFFVFCLGQLVAGKTRVLLKFCREHPVD